MSTAYFVKYPRNAEEVRQPHDIRAQKPYEIVKTIPLSSIDYENFVTDLLADRQFLEDNAHLCAAGNPMRCLFVHCESCAVGLLVVPDTAYEPAHVKFAAYISELKQ